MLRGNALAKLDPKGRLKLPASYRKFIEPNFGKHFFVTSLRGDSARLYPIDVYARMEEELARTGKFGSRIHKLATRLNYYGQPASMDGQGRVLIHPLLRKAAGLKDEVTVLGMQNYLEVWDLSSFEARMQDDPLTNEDLDALADLGI